MNKMGVPRKLQSLDLGLVLTGGTVASELSPDEVLRIPQPTGAVWGTELDLLSQAWGSRGDLLIRPRQPLRTLSENILPGDWLSIADAARDLVERDNVAGVLVLHGTDTAAYTTAALSFLLADLEVPIVLTGSNLPPDQSGSDALVNIGDALVALSELKSGVYLSFAGEPGLPSIVHLGTCVRKLRASGQAFYSVNREPVGRVSGGHYMTVSQPNNHRSGPDYLSRSVEPRVLGIRLYPGLDFEALSTMVGQGGIRGVVLELYASATGPDVPGRCSLPAFVKRCTHSGIPVCACLTKAPEEGVNVYESSVAIADAGAIILDDMLPETAIAKLMWTLAGTGSPDGIRRIMESPIAGERPLHG
jgi:L-asparaginase/Glu-tRNA(Gln) amidotransferase subunit D